MPAPKQHKREQKSLFSSIFGWFFENDFGLGPPVDTRHSNHGNYPHVHSWEFFNTIRCGWRVEEGQPVGERVAINLAILDVEKHPGQNETKASELRAWQASGYDYVHTSQTVYHCKSPNCNITKTVEVYVAPVTKNGSGPIVVDVGLRYQKKFTETNRIACVTTVNNRKEVAIEPMKRHGNKYKPVRPAPIVPMED